MGSLDGYTINVLVAWFVIYYLVERVLKHLVRTASPPFYAYLHKTRKDLVFFGISMGAIISITFFPFCGKAFWNSLHARDQPTPDGAWMWDRSSQICVASRAVLWISELNRLEMYPVYVYHHLGSLLVLVMSVGLRWPEMSFFVIFTTLVSEVPGDLVYMVSTYSEGLVEQGSSMKLHNSYLERVKVFRKHLVQFNVWQYALIRAVAIIVSVYGTLPSSPRTKHVPIVQRCTMQLYLAIYAMFCVSYVKKQTSTIAKARHNSPAPTTSIKDGPMTVGNGHIQTLGPRNAPDPSKLARSTERRISFHLSRQPYHLRIHMSRQPDIILTVYGPLMGMGLSALALAAFLLNSDPSDIHATALLNKGIALTITSSVVGARLFSIIFEDGLEALVRHPVRTIFRPGFWLHGGLFGTCVGTVISSGLGYVSDWKSFMGSLGVGIGAYETTSRVGCHTYGCCYGRTVASLSSGRSRKGKALPSGPHSLVWKFLPFPPTVYTDPNAAVIQLDPSSSNVSLVPIQLISAAIFGLLFLLVSLPLSIIASPALAGSVTLIGHSFVRLLTEQYRADFRGGSDKAWLSSTAKMALLQLVVCGAAAVHILRSGGWDWELVMDSRPHFDFSPVELRSMWSVLYAFVFGTVVYGIHRGKIGQWVSPPIDVKMR